MDREGIPAMGGMEVIVFDIGRIALGENEKDSMHKCLYISKYEYIYNAQ